MGTYRHIGSSSFPDHLVGRKSVLGEFEQTVMLAILQLGDDAYAPNIARHLDETIDRSRGAPSIPA